MTILESVLKIITSKYFWLALAAAVLFSLGAFTVYYFFVKPPTVIEVIDGGYVETAPVDEMLTAHMALPILKVKHTRGILDVLTGSRPEGKVTGYCIREYEVDVGFDSIADMVKKRPEIMNEVCQGSDQSVKTFVYLPEPTLLKIYAGRTLPYGNFSRYECDSLDLQPKPTDSRTRFPVKPIESVEEGPSDPLFARHSKVILNDMMKNEYRNHWNTIVKKSKVSLAGYLYLFCEAKSVQAMLQKSTQNNQNQKLDREESDEK